MKTTNFEAETWFQRPETPSRVLEPLGTKINFAACHRSDAMVAKKVEYRSDLKYGVTVVSHQMASADSPGSPLGFQTPPPLPRWPLEAMMASRHLQAPESGSQQRSRAGFRTRQVPKRPLESRKASKASAHPGRSLEAIRGRAGLQDTSAHSGLVTWVAQGFHVPPGTQTSSKRPPDLQTPPSPPYCTQMTSGGLPKD